MSNSRTKTTANQKLKKILIVAAVVVITAALIGLAVYNSCANDGTTLRSQTAMQSENFKIDGAMMSYLYSVNFQNFSGYFNSLGVDTSKSLKTQKCPLTTNGTWFDYIMQSAESEASEILALCEQAKKNGVELDADDLKTIDTYTEQLKETAKGYGYSDVNTYLYALARNPVKLQDVVNCLKLSSLATKYSQKFNDEIDLSEERMEKYYEDNKESFDGVDYYTWTVKAEDFEAQDDKTTAQLAQELSDAMSKVESVDAFVSMIRAQVEADVVAEEGETEEALEARRQAKVDEAFKEHALKASLPEVVAAWAFGDDAKAGETFVETNDEKDIFTLYMLAKESYRQDEKTRNVRHILFSNSKYEDDTKAQEVLGMFLADKTEEKFTELCAEYSDDTGSNTTGGLYENVYPGQMVAEFNDWLFDPARAEGDTDVVKAESTGWHIIWYLGESNITRWQVSAQSALRSADYQDMISQYSDAIKTNDSVVNLIAG